MSRRSPAYRRLLAVTFTVTWACWLTMEPAIIHIYLAGLAVACLTKQPQAREHFQQKETHP